MKIKFILILGVFAVALAATFVVSGCGSSPIPAPGPAEKAGAALDKAIEKTEVQARETADKALDKTGEVLEKAGAALEKTGADMKDGQTTGSNP